MSKAQRNDCGEIVLCWSAVIPSVLLFSPGKIEDFKAASIYMHIYIWTNLINPFRELTFNITLYMLTTLKLFVAMDLDVIATQFILKDLFQTGWCSFAQNGSFFKIFFNPFNFDLQIHFKMVLEWSEHSFIAKILPRITLWQFIMQLCLKWVFFQTYF